MMGGGGNQEKHLCPHCQAGRVLGAIHDVNTIQRVVQVGWRGLLKLSITLVQVNYLVFDYYALLSENRDF